MPAGSPTAPHSGSIRVSVGAKARGCGLCRLSPRGVAGPTLWTSGAASLPSRIPAASWQPCLQTDGSRVCSPRPYCGKQAVR